MECFKTQGFGTISLIQACLSPEGGDGVGDFVLEDFDEFFVFVNDFLLGFDLRDDLILLAD